MTSAYYKKKSSVTARVMSYPNGLHKTDRSKTDAFGSKYLLPDYKRLAGQRHNKLKILKYCTKCHIFKEVKYSYNSMSFTSLMQDKKGFILHSFILLTYLS